MELRPYQGKLISDVRTAIKAGHRDVLAVLPTGGGKTVIASFLAKSCVERGQSYWFVCHRDFLVDQTLKTFQANGIHAGVIAAGHKPQYHLQVQVCMIDTLKNRLQHLDPPKLMNWDECHHLKAAGWERVHAWAEGAIHVGLTATPERLDGKGLGPPFTAMVEGPTTGELMAMGALSRYVAYAPSMPNLEDVHEVAGDYNQKELAAAVERSVIVGDVVGSYCRFASGLRAVYFCPSVPYSKRLADKFNAEGIRARHLDGECSTQERVSAAMAFARGELDVLTNCFLFGEGYDLAAQAGMDVTIEAVGLVRPTKSMALYRQQVGRALRPKDRPAVLIDHAGNIEAHGLPDSDVVWSLEGRKKGPPRVSDVKLCKKCLAMNPAGARVCEQCGEPLNETTERNGPDAVDGELHEVNREAILARDAEKAEAKRAKAQRLAEEARCQSIYDWQDLARARGYRPGWAFKKHLEVQMRVETQAAAQKRR